MRRLEALCIWMKNIRHCKCNRHSSHFILICWNLPMRRSWGGVGGSPWKTQITVWNLPMRRSRGVGGSPWKTEISVGTLDKRIYFKCYCRSRDEIALWKEKQIQVAREEARVKESLAKLAEESKGGQLTKRGTNRGEASVADSKVIPDLICHQQESIRDFYFDQQFLC